MVILMNLSNKMIRDFETFCNLHDKHVTVNANTYSDTINKSKTTAYNHINMYIANGLVEKVGVNEFAITDKGRSVIDKIRDKK